MRFALSIFIANAAIISVLIQFSTHPFITAPLAVILLTIGYGVGLKDA